VNAEGNPAATYAHGQKFIPPEAEGDRAPNKNYLHSNPYPNTAAPGQSPRECEPGNLPQDWFTGGWNNAVELGNIAGDQGLLTEGQTQQQLDWVTK
jgi:hypothetical protein